MKVVFKHAIPLSLSFLLTQGIDQDIQNLWYMREIDCFVDKLCEAIWILVLIIGC